MKVSKSSANQEILDSGMVILYHGAADLTFFFEEGRAGFRLEMHFLTDASGQQHVQQKNCPGGAVLECYNFGGVGAGTAVPYEFASFNGRKMYLAFWIYQEGKNPNIPRTRSVKYTIYMEPKRQVGKGGTPDAENGV